jgi:hypothetical protein
MAMRAPHSICEDLAYTNQFFSITREGHTRPTAEFGAPAMVWHISFWPRRQYDPHDMDMIDRTNPTDLKNATAVLAEHGERFGKVIENFNSLLMRLRQRGCVQNVVPGGDIFKHEPPADWDNNNGDAYRQFTTNSHGFTLWWTDNPPSDLSRNMVGNSPNDRPRSADVRVRVQSEVSEDFFSVTFYIDAGRPWDAPQIYNSREARARNALGTRRSTIFKQTETVKSLCESRMKCPDGGTALVDLPLLPERIKSVPPEQPGDDMQRWLANEAEAAKALLEAADYLYKIVWDDFCRDFGFNLCDLVGDTDEVFANFRGLVLSTAGVEKADAVPSTPTAVGGLTPFNRFEGSEGKHHAKVFEPNAVVKAYMPFMRRFRPEADWRDWIACGLFNWRAIYLTSLGSQSEYRSFDDGELDTTIPGGHLPQRLVRTHASDDPKQEKACAAFASLNTDNERFPPIAGDLRRPDRPAPFRYLLLTKYEPNRRQVGRIIERINTTGMYRLYALKNWNILQQAGTWLRTYGQQLDAAYKLWIDNERNIRGKHRIKEDAFRKRLALEVEKLENVKYKKQAVKILFAETQSVDRLAQSLLNCRKEYYDSMPLFRKLLLSKWLDEDRENWEEIVKCFAEIRIEKDNFDRQLGECNIAAEGDLVKITSELDRLGRAAIGGLSYRVSKSRYYAEAFRNAALSLRAGAIETWWSYDQFVKRGMEPALRYIENVGIRLEKLRERLQAVKGDILQSSINHQTEATRDNTHKLERIQDTLRSILLETEYTRRSTLRVHTVYLVFGIILTVTNLILAAPKIVGLMGSLWGAIMVH